MDPDPRFGFPTHALPSIAPITSLQHRFALYDIVPKLHRSQQIIDCLPPPHQLHHGPSTIYDCPPGQDGLSTDVLQLRYGLLDFRVRCWSPRRCPRHSTLPRCDWYYRRRPGQQSLLNSYDCIIIHVSQSVRSSDSMHSLTTSHVSLGCLVMAVTLVCTNFGFRFGRRWSILGGDLLVIVGGAIQASSYSVAQIVRLSLSRHNPEPILY